MAVGFVDLFFLFGMRFVDAVSEQSDSCKQTATVIGLDACCLPVAKSLVLLEMLRTADVPLASVVQVWLSSVWQTETSQHFKQAVRSTLATQELQDGFHGLSDQRDVANLLQFWLLVDLDDEALRLSSVHQEWRRRNDSESSRHFPIANLLRKSDRVEYSRYFLTGEFPLLSSANSDLDCGSLTGNVTMFACPDAYAAQQPEESVLSAVSLRDVLSADTQSGNTVMQRTYQYVLQQLQSIRECLLQQKLQVRLFHQVVQLGDHQLLRHLADLRPFSVVWSNLCDYMQADQFHALARCISCTGTLHYMHSMNWHCEVLGACITDVPAQLKARAAAASRKLIRHQLREYDCFDSRGLFDHPVNLASFALSYYICDHWSRHFFGNQKLTAAPKCSHVEFIPTLCNYNTLLMEWKYEA